MNILKIDHIGVAVCDLDKYLKLFGEVMGLEIHDAAETDPYGGLRSAFARIGDTDFEFLQDRASDGGGKVIDQRDIARWIEKRGEGLHHVALRVDNIEEAMKDARANGLQVIDEKPRPGARGSKIAFLHPKSTGGILIHFVEREG
ncbi:MAG: methylmalonyl-CoA epimerase [Candidatus Binatia bacterium]